MAFDFLSNTMAPSDSAVLSGASGGSSNPFSTISNLLNLGGQVASVANIAKGYQPTAAEGNTNQALSNQNALLQAILDPNSTIYKNVLAGQTQQLNNTTQQGINDLLQQNRKAQLMGRQTFFNPERQDEAVSQYLTRQSDTNAATARSNALNQIIQAANGYNQQAGNFRQMIPLQQQAQNQNAAALPTALSGAGSILGQFGQGGSMSNIGQAVMTALPAILAM